MHRFVMGMALVCGLAAGTAAAQPASLSGFVRDATSGETLLLANVVLVQSQTGTATNNTGYYTLTGLAPGTYTVAATFIGYRPARVDVTLAAGEHRRLDLELVPFDVLIDEVTVTAERELEAEARRLGAAQLQTDVVRAIPAVLEPDVFRSLQLLPGVKAASDYSSGLYIRGGSPDQTLILLDRTTVYNPTHVFGFFSTFNPDAIKDVRLYKGGYPAEYGGRLGAVVDIYNKDGNRRETRGSASAGLLASRAIVEGPYARGSWMAAVRRSTLEPLLAVLRAADVEGIPDNFYFYDANGKLNFDAGRDDRFSISFYTGRDALGIGIFEGAQLDLNYGNRTVTGNWTHLFSQRLFSNFTVTASHYASTPRFEFGGTPFEQNNSVDDVSVKGDFEYIPNERHAVEGGFWAGSFTLRYRNVFDGEATLDERIPSVYGSAYLQETYRPTSRWSIQTGLRASYFGEGTYLRLEPRLSLEHRPVEGLRLQAGYGRYYQYLTVISSELFSGFDTWLTTGEGVPPSYGDQYVAGVKTQVPPGLDLDLEVYYRTMRGLFDFDPDLPDVAGLPYHRLFIFGDGHAYGAEVLLRRSEGRLNGFVSYTLGRTQRRFPGINGGAYYSPKHDRTHDLNAVVNVDVTDRWRLTGVFTYATGQAYTDPLGHYNVAAPFGVGQRSVLVTDLNNARLPAYHRLDLGARRRGRFFGFADYELMLQVINVYSRRNIWFFLFEAQDDGGLERQTVPQIPVPLPNVALTLNF